MMTKKERKELEVLRMMVRQLSGPVIREYEAELSARGRKAARARHRKLSPEQRREIARLAARARWAKKEAQ